MSFPKLRLPLLAAAAVVAFAGAAAAQTAQLTLLPPVANWKEPVVARIIGTGCTGEFAPVAVVGDRVTIELRHCIAPSAKPFAVDVPLPPLYPDTYTVYVVSEFANADPPQPPLATASLEVHLDGDLAIGLPAVARDDEDVAITLRAVASSGCYSLDLDQPGGNLIEGFFDDSCPLIPVGPPRVAEVTFHRRLAPGTYEVRFYNTSATADKHDAPMVHATFVVHDHDLCLPDEDTLCLQDDRFAVEVAWRDFAGATGKGHLVELAGQDGSGLFWFFSPDNVEQTVKVIDGCSLNGHWWVFVSSGTTVENRVVVRETRTGVERWYDNAAGEAAPLVTATSAFACTP